MRKAEYKRMRGVKENYVQDRLRLKRIFCTSIKHVRWMKRYINRAPRHKEKREEIEVNNNYCPIQGASQPKEQPKTIVERIGEPAFLEQLAEECSELAQAALKTARKYRGENPTPKTIDECYDALQEEIADVMLCVSEYLDCKGPDYLNCVMLMKFKKCERWERRLEEVGK